MLVLGIAGSLIATGNLLATAFTGAVAALVVTLLGLTIVGAAIGRTVRKPRDAGPGIAGGDSSIKRKAVVDEIGSRH